MVKYGHAKNNVKISLPYQGSGQLGELMEIVFIGPSGNIITKGNAPYEISSDILRKKTSFNVKIEEIKSLRIENDD